LVRESLDMHNQQVLNLLAYDEVFLSGIYGMDGVGKTLLATLVENEVNRKSFTLFFRGLLGPKKLFSFLYQV